MGGGRKVSAFPFLSPCCFKFILKNPLKRQLAVGCPVSFLAHDIMWLPTRMAECKVIYTKILGIFLPLHSIIQFSSFHWSEPEGSWNPSENFVWSFHQFCMSFSRGIVYSNWSSISNTEVDTPNIDSLPSLWRILLLFHWTKWCDMRLISHIQVCW